MKQIEYHLLDVFTNKRFGGNQLAVFPDASAIPEDDFQHIARELNLSETVFLSPPDATGAYPMRIFTPAQELPTAGHPTIGTAFLLASLTNDKSQSQKIVLKQKAGLINVDIEIQGGEPKMATMFQILPTFGPVYEERKEIAELLSLTASDLLDFPIQQVSCGVPYIIVPVKNLAAVRKVIFRNDLWENLRDQLKNQSIYIFTLEGELSGSDLHGRMFAPEIGITEDPATGSANGPLGCYLLHHDIMSGPLVSEQGFEIGRPSILHIDIQEERGNITAVKISGQAVFIGKGSFYIDK